MRVIGWRNPASRREIEYKQLTKNLSCGQPEVDDLRLEQEHTWYDPKDGELRLSTPKPGETLVEGGSDTNVQIVRQTWV